MKRKKWLAFMMAGAMVLGCGLSAFAEETEENAGAEDSDTILELSYEDIDPDVYEGEWFSFEYGFDLYLPVDWAEMEITDDMLEDGVVYDLADTVTGMNVAISVVTLEELGEEIELEEIYQELESNGYEELYYVDCNGIGGVGYDVPDENISGIAFLGESGNMYLVTLGPVPEGDETAEATATNILLSLSPSETEEEE